jgi:hypothetical protein
MDSKSTGTLVTLAVVGAAAYALYEYVLSQCNAGTPPSWLPFSCANIPGYVAAVPTPANTPASQPTGPAVANTTAVLTNVTAPGQPYQAGDSFQLVVTGPANAPVIGTASQNGSVSSSTNFGNTDATGTKIITGTWDATNIGQWQQAWQVGNSQPAALSFTIAAKGVSGLGLFTPYTVKLGQSPFAGNRIPMNMIHRGNG